MIQDITTEQIAGYKLYLDLIHARILDKAFDEQAPYLRCKKGCSHCCEWGQYPMSAIEINYILIKVSELSEEKRLEILKNIQDLIEQFKNKNSAEPFFYKCPFLLNGICSVYENRAIICRTHGLMFFLDDNEGNEKYKIPSCVNLGLNYSNVYDKELKTITDKLYEKSGIKFPPQAYNLSLKTLSKKEITSNLGFEFGEFKSLIEWFM